MAPSRSRTNTNRRRVGVALVAATTLAVGAYFVSSGGESSRRSPHSAVSHHGANASHTVIPVDIYAATSVLRPEIATDLSRLFVPSGFGDMVTVIAPATNQILSQLSTGRGFTPPPVVPSFYL